MIKRPVVALLTDFGDRDGYVSSMKGVLLSQNPNIQFLDVTHQVSPQNINEAAFTLLANYAYFPKGVICISVIDPTVGAGRKILCAKTSKGFFIAPDNGLLSPVLEREENPIVRSVENKKLFLSKVSSTFHGRDIMSPVAAYLSKAGNFSNVGPKMKKWNEIGWEKVFVEKRRVQGSVVSIDRFGNIISNITEEDVKSFLGEDLIIKIKKNEFKEISQCFSDVKQGKSLCLWNSLGLLEVAINQGDAAKNLKVRLGDKLSVIVK